MHLGLMGRFEYAAALAYQCQVLSIECLIEVGVVLWEVGGGRRRSGFGSKDFLNLFSYLSPGG